ncbi:MAG: ricin-type beta-trefoil lectin domain protein [Desulfobacteraceae bacterium]|jgi:hypothetical protein
MSSQKTFLPLFALLFLIFSYSVTFADIIVNSEGFTVNRHYDEHTDGAIINLWKENYHISQQWDFNTNRTISSRTNDDFCLNIHNNSIVNGAVVNLWSCNGHDSQKWRRVGNLIKPLNSPDYCLNLHNYDNSNGATINLWQCNGHASQDWLIE